MTSTLPNSTRRIVVAARPNGYPTLSGQGSTFTLTNDALPKDLPPNHLLLKTTHLANDPILRDWLAGNQDPHRHYRPVVKIGDVVPAYGLAEVLATSDETGQFNVADIVVMDVGWTEYAIVATKEVRPAPDLGTGLSRTLYLGALGPTGLTAYFALFSNLQVTASDTLVVSSAAGATGSLAVQIAKKVIGCKKVIGFAGSDQKCSWVKSIGADVCFNYKAVNFEEQWMQATADDPPTAYLDLVGGKTLERVWKRMAKRGRIAAVGDMANYNASSIQGLGNWLEVVKMSLAIRGFLIYDYAERFVEGTEFLEKAVRDGKIDVAGSERVVEAKFEDVPRVWMKLFEGGESGKLVTEVVGESGKA